MKTRRQFLGEASCAAIGSTSVLSTLLNVTMANHAAAFTGTGRSSPALRTKEQAIRDVVASPIEALYKNVFQRTHGRITSNSVERGIEFGGYFSVVKGLLGSRSSTISASPPCSPLRTG